MLDTEWFMQAINGDRLVVRMHVTVSPRTGQLSTEIFVYGHWYDDMMPNGFEIVYRHDEKRDWGVLPLELNSLPSDINTWQNFMVEKAKGWSKYWEQPHETVCTVGVTRKSCHQIKPSHPLALSHLARFQAAAALADVDLGWGVSIAIVARRLEGIVRAGVKSWHQLLG